MQNTEDYYENFLQAEIDVEKLKKKEKFIKAKKDGLRLLRQIKRQLFTIASHYTRW